MALISNFWRFLAGALALTLVFGLLSACTVPERRPVTAGQTAVTAPPKPAWVARKVVADGAPVKGGRQHIVKPGETGIAIALAYKVAWRDIVAANALVPPYLLQVGDKLLIPSRQAAAKAPRPQKGADQGSDRGPDRGLEQRARGFSLDIDDIVTGGEPATARPTPNAVPQSNQAPDLAANSPRFRWPVEGRIISGFGPKSGGRYNDGVNLKVASGTPVRAAADGTVAYAGDAIPGFGNLILLRHANGWVTAYGHNEALLIERGKTVKAGEVIARAGATGQVDEPQLHFEIRRGRVAMDPQTLLAGR